MSNAPKDHAPSFPEKQINVRRGRVESVDLYEIKENELEVLEKGTAAGLYLNFSIFLISIAFAAITTLSTATFTSTRVETLYLLVSVVGTLGGLFLAILWWKTKESVSDVVQEIRGRIPPEANASISSSEGEVDPIG